MRDQNNNGLMTQTTAKVTAKDSIGELNL